MKLYTFYRSQATYRVRIALHIKGLKHDDVFIHLVRGEQFDPVYAAVNPQMVVPTLFDGDAKLIQSLAILEYLEEKYPNPPLLPKDLLARAWVRAFALINIADSHPLITPRIRHYLTREVKLPEAQALAWIRHWLGVGLQAMEKLLSEHKAESAAGRFCHGDAPSFADIGLVTQVTPAKMFDCDLRPYPKVMEVYQACMALPAFAETHPAKQPDAE